MLKLEFRKLALYISGKASQLIPDLGGKTILISMVIEKERCMNSTRRIEKIKNPSMMMKITGCQPVPVLFGLGQYPTKSRTGLTLVRLKKLRNGTKFSVLRG